MKDQTPKPQFIILYQCSACGMESSFSDLQEPECRYCDEGGMLSIISKERITPEVMAARMKASTDTMMNALMGAYDALSKEAPSPENAEEEKMLLELMAEAKALKDIMQGLKLRSPEEE